ncbi:MAG: glycoside hydrolase family 92 protein, partial [Cyclobacteriaceae bacterium]|nr:glycoside hydrolase family 92 protein [Cyclobacteriaceae bacterium]
DVVTSARNVWANELSVIEIQSDDEYVLKNFYTALYHTKIAPMIFNDVDGRYLGIDQKIHQSSGRRHYTVYSLWDTFRSWYPLMTIIEPDRAGAWAFDLYQHFLEGGLLPKWPLNGNYTGTMVGYPAVSILADAYQKGIIDTIPEKMLESAIISSTWQASFNEKHKGTKAAGVMPIHIKYKEELGFVPIDKCSESVSYGLEMAYYDWCVAQLAKITGDQQTIDRYIEKGKAYRKYYDPELKFMRGINSDGSWDKDFNPRYSDHQKSEFVEGNAYQWTPFVPHDPVGFAELLGGQEALGIWLDSLFTTSSELVGEHASGDITGLIGQYAHGNEPSHHIPFLYKYSDRPWRTEEVIDTILYHFYQPVPSGIIGNEDCGQMSAWYVLNALGIYQLAPGNSEFLVGRPIVDHAKIKTGGGWFEIEVINNSKTNKYVKEVKLNGKAIENHGFDYVDIKAGSKLEFFMTNKP